MGQAASGPLVDLLDFKWAMSRVPGAVVIATTLDRQGVPHGLTASSFTSVSLQPPLVSICVARSAVCHEGFCSAEHFSICMLSAGQGELATRFATRGANKFVGPEVMTGSYGLPLVRDAVVSLVCKRHAVVPAGDHSLLLGEVLSATTDERHPVLVYCQRQYGTIVTRAPASKVP